MRRKSLLLFATTLMFVSAVVQTDSSTDIGGTHDTWSSSAQATGGSGAAFAQATGSSGYNEYKNNSPAPAVGDIKVVYDNTDQTEKLEITGSNFSSYKESVHVTVDSAQADVIRSDPGSITAVLPQGIKNSTAFVSVEINGQTVVRNKKIKTPPKVTGLSLLSGPPGIPVTIYGERFADKLSDNKVTIGGMEVPVSSGSKTELTVVIPAALDMQSPTWGVPVKVEVNGVSSNSNMGIRVQNRVY